MSASYKPWRCIVAGLGGHLCSLDFDQTCSVQDVKHAVQASTGIPWQQQRLIVEDVELGNSEKLGLQGPVLQVTLLRRSEQQAEWLHKVETASHGSILMSAPKNVRADQEVVMAAVRHHGRALGYAAESLQGSREVVLAAVRQAGWSLQYASEALRRDPQVVLEAVRESGRALNFASQEMQADRDVVLAAIGSDGLALQYASAALRADYNVVLRAVQQDGRAREFAEEPLRSDARIAWAANRDDAVDGHTLRLAAMQQGRLYRVVADGVARGWISSYALPDATAETVGMHERGKELVAAGSPVLGWLPLNDLQLDGPLIDTAAQWVLMDGASLGFGRLVEQVSGKHAARAVGGYPEFEPREEACALPSFGKCATVGQLLRELHFWTRTNGDTDEHAILHRVRARFFARMQQIMAPDQTEFLKVWMNSHGRDFLANKLRSAAGLLESCTAAAEGFWEVGRNGESRGLSSPCKLHRDSVRKGTGQADGFA